MKKKAKKKGKVDSIEKLAVLMAEGFADVDARFSAVDARFSHMEDRFSNIDSQLAEIKKMIKNIDERLMAVESKLSGIQRRLDSEAMERIDVKSLFARLEKVEQVVFGNKRT